MQEYVLHISTVNAVLPEGINEVVTPYPPTPFQSIIFYCNNPVSMGKAGTDNFSPQPHSVVVGPQFSRVNIRVSSLLRAIRVDFLPGGIYRMLRIPMSELFDGGFDAIDLFGAGMKRINEQLKQISSLGEGKDIVESFLLEQVKRLSGLTPVDKALRTLFAEDGNASIERIASISCLSLKQFERKCYESIGMNPKLYARILRFSKAYRLHEAFPELSWIQIAYQAGYYDQMHMIKDFKIFAGVNPSVIEKELLSTPLRMQKDLFG